MLKLILFYSIVTAYTINLQTLDIATHTIFYNRIKQNQDEQAMDQET